MSLKAPLIDLIRQTLKENLERLTAAAREAHDAATDPSSKAEGKYDTRSLEASYLAAGQAKQVDDLAAAVQRFETFDSIDFDITDPIAAGALVEIEIQDEPSHYLLAPAAGGLTLDYQGMEITLLTPASALYQQLLGKAVGDSLTSPAALITELS